MGTEDDMNGDESHGAAAGARVAVVGGGLSGLSAARELVRAGTEVTVYERGRGPGGRAARRRAEGFEFDHGAQYFTARTPDFTALTRDWVARGIVDRWSAALATAGDGRLREKTSSTTRYVGVPGMSALARDLAAGIDLRLGARVTGARTSTSVGAGVRRRNGDTNRGWLLSIRRADPAGGASELEETEGPFDALILACTPAQGLPLVDAETAFAGHARGLSFEPVWALLLGFDGAPDIPADGIFIDHPALSWAARNDSKPGRGGGPAWVVHASSDWSRGREEEPADRIVSALLPAFEEAIGVRLPEPVYAAAHRWRYARPAQSLGDGFLWDAELAVGMCGDWCNGARVEGAFESGLQLARHMRGGSARVDDGRPAQ